MHINNTIEVSTGGGSFALTVQDQDNQPIENVKTYLFSEGGSYLGESRLTDANGQAGYAMANGSYIFRIDYLGYQLWTDTIDIPSMNSLTHVINHQNVMITALGITMVISSL